MCFLRWEDVATIFFVSVLYYISWIFEYLFSVAERGDWFIYSVFFCINIGIEFYIDSFLDIGNFLKQSQSWKKRFYFQCNDLYIVTLLQFVFPVYSNYQHVSACQSSYYQNYIINISIYTCSTIIILDDEDRIRGCY